MEWLIRSGHRRLGQRDNRSPLKKALGPQADCCQTMSLIGQQRHIHGVRSYRSRDGEGTQMDKRTQLYLDLQEFSKAERAANVNAHKLLELEVQSEDGRCLDRLARKRHYPSYR